MDNMVVKQTILLIALVLALLVNDGLAGGVGCSGRTCLKGQASGGIRVGGLRTRVLQKKAKKAKEAEAKSRMAHSKKLRSAPSSISGLDASTSNDKRKYKGSDTNSNDDDYPSFSNTASRISAPRSNDDTPSAPFIITLASPIATPMPTPSLPTLPPFLPPTIPPTPAPQVSAPPPVATPGPPPPTSPPSESPSLIPTEISSRAPTIAPTTAPSASPSFQPSPRLTPRSELLPNELPPTANPPETLCIFQVELVCVVAADGMPCESLLIDREAAESCIVSLGYAYTILNNGTGPILLTEMAREFNGETDDLLLDRLLVIPPGESLGETETVEVDLCEDGAKTVFAVMGDSVLVDGTSCSAVAQHTLGLVGTDV